jgi:hypothetical protein
MVRYFKIIHPFVFIQRSFTGNWRITTNQMNFVLLRKPHCRKRSEGKRERNTSQNCNLKTSPHSHTCREYNNVMRSEAVQSAVVVCVVTSCGLECSSEHFGRTHRCLLVTQAILSSETMVTAYKITWRHNSRLQSTCNNVFPEVTSTECSWCSTTHITKRTQQLLIYGKFHISY